MCLRAGFGGLSKPQLRFSSRLRFSGLAITATLHVR